MKQIKNNFWFDILSFYHPKALDSFFVFVEEISWNREWKQI